jgi:D-alanyl-D-alanine carboxypeptidase/D-alanyl-D-alanine-endopeptidase (penicillin-binding protein 4)
MRVQKLARPFVAVAVLVLTAVTVGQPLTATAVPGGAAVAVADDPALTANLDKILTDSRLNGAGTSMQVRDGATGAVVYSRGADQRVIPASNEKLMTSAAALQVLGPAYRFHTRVSYTGTKTGRTVSGNLYLQGRGDPTLTAADLDRMAAAVVTAGITRVNGALVGDDNFFDRVPLGLDWSWQDESYAYAAPISALTVASTADFDTGSVAVYSRAGAATGRPAVVGLVPATSAVTVVNRTTTGAAGSADTVTAVRQRGTNTVVVTGSSPLRAAAAVDLVSVASPAQVAVSVFRDALKRRGVTVVGATTVGGGTPPTAKLVTDRASITLAQLLVPFLKLSNNGHAELLVKAMSRVSAPTIPGNWTTGLTAAADALRALGVDPQVVRLGDGSGLTRRNWLTTRQIANLLHGAQTRPWFTTWYAALPIAGNPNRLVGGTLGARMRGTAAADNLHAKTGTLSGVNALSGYVNDATGRRLVVSIVVNNALSNVADVLDRAAVTLAQSGAGTASARSVPPPVPAAPVAVNREGQDVECSWVRAC